MYILTVRRRDGPCAARTFDPPLRPPPRVGLTKTTPPVPPCLSPEPPHLPATSCMAEVLAATSPIEVRPPLPPSIVVSDDSQFHEATLGLLHLLSETLLPRQRQWLLEALCDRFVVRPPVTPMLPGRLLLGLSPEDEQGGSWEDDIRYRRTPALGVVTQPSDVVRVLGELAACITPVLLLYGVRIFLSVPRSRGTSGPPNSGDVGSRRRHRSSARPPTTPTAAFIHESGCCCRVDVGQLRILSARAPITAITPPCIYICQKNNNRGIGNGPTPKHFLLRRRCQRMLQAAMVSVILDGRDQGYT